jgi:hypothetical protein
MPAAKTVTTAAKTKRRNARKVAKRYRMVTFVNDLFDDDFTFPDFEQMPLGIVEALNTGAMEKVTAWLVDAGVEAESVEAFRSLTQDEINDFISDWNKGALALPKSSS